MGDSTYPSGRVLLLEGEGFTRASPVQAALQDIASEVRASTAPPETLDGWDLALIHYDSFLPPARDVILRQFDALRARGRVLVYVSAPSRETVSRLLAEVRVTNLFASECPLDIDALLVTVRKLLSADIFGIDQYFPHPIRSLRLCVGSTLQKGDVLETAAAFARDVARPERLVAQFTTALDEMISNALFNAPVDAEGQFRFACLPRTELVTLDPGEQVDIELRCDERRLGVSVCDPFGTLTVEALTRYVGQRIGVSTGRRSSAGVGLFSVLSSVSHLAVNLAPKRKTEFIVLLDIRGSSYREFVRRGTAFNLFVAPL